MTRIIALAIILVGLTVSTSFAGDRKQDPLALQLSGRFASAGQTVTLRMRVEPDARSRDITIEWVGADLSGGSHVINLDGANGPSTYRYEMKKIAAGDCLVTVVLRRNDGTTIERTTTLTVVGNTPGSRGTNAISSFVD